MCMILNFLRMENANIDAKSEVDVQTGLSPTDYDGKGKKNHRFYRFQVKYVCDFYKEEVYLIKRRAGVFCTDGVNLH